MARSVANRLIGVERGLFGHSLVRCDPVFFAEPAREIQIGTALGAKGTVVSQGLRLADWAGHLSSPDARKRPSLAFALQFIEPHLGPAHKARFNRIPAERCSDRGLKTPPLFLRHRREINHDLPA